MVTGGHRGALGRGDLGRLQTPSRALLDVLPRLGSGGTGLDTRLGHDDDTFPGRDVRSPRRGRLNPLPSRMRDRELLPFGPYLQVDAPFRGIFSRSSLESNLDRLSTNCCGSSQLNTTVGGFRTSCRS